VGLIGLCVCDGCGYRSRPVLLGAYGDLYDMALGTCASCAEIIAFDPDVTQCPRCGRELLRLTPSEDGEVSCPRCGRVARLVGDDDDLDE
jgi:DNA-directed RNA polymerase subunit RPC12/RpoP